MTPVRAMLFECGGDIPLPAAEPCAYEVYMSTRRVRPAPCCTGGLSLKTKEGMPGMKADCGGAAALLAAFEAAVEIGVGDRALHLVLCLAENAIGPGAMRNDDGATCGIEPPTAWTARFRHTLTIRACRVPQ